MCKLSIPVVGKRRMRSPNRMLFLLFMRKFGVLNLHTFRKKMHFIYLFITFNKCAYYDLNLVPTAAVNFQRIICSLNAQWSTAETFCPSYLCSVNCIFFITSTCNYVSPGDLNNKASITGQAKKKLPQRTVSGEKALRACMFIAISKNAPQTPQLLPALTHWCVILKDNQGNYSIRHN